MDCLLRSVDFAVVEELQRTGRWHQAGKLLAAEAQALVAGGAELLVLCTNTMHRVADQIAAAVAVPLVHLPTPPPTPCGRRGCPPWGCWHGLHHGAGLLPRTPAAHPWAGGRGARSRGPAPGP